MMNYSTIIVNYVLDGYWMLWGNIQVVFKWASPIFFFDFLKIDLCVGNTLERYLQMLNS